MNDKELLELAAKAASVPLDDLEECWDGIGNYYRAWNPLTDDGDALRLAVELGISIDPYPVYSRPKHAVITKQRRRGDMMRESNPTEVVVPYGDDPYAATRRAIVRAAAEIGRRM